MELRPRASLTGEELSSFIFSTPPSSSGSFPIRAPLTLDEELEGDEDYDSEPNFPRIKLSSSNGASTSSEISETALERSFVADPAEEAGRIHLESPKDWSFGPFAVSPGGSSNGGEDAVLVFEEGLGRVWADPAKEAERIHLEPPKDWIFRPLAVSSGVHSDSEEDVHVEFVEGLSRVRAVPIARLSVEFDGEEEEKLRVVEEDGIVARVPGFVARDDKEGLLAGNGSGLKVISRGDMQEVSEVLEVNVANDLSAEDATVSTVSNGEMSESNGVSDGLSGGENMLSVEVEPHADYWSQLELLEMSIGEDLSEKGMMQSYVSDEEVGECNGVAPGIAGDNTLSLETKSFNEDKSLLLGREAAGNLLLKDAEETSSEEGSSECPRVKEVESSGPRSALVLSERMRDFDSERQPLMGNVEVGISYSGFIDYMESYCVSEAKDTTENEQRLASDLELEVPILDSVKSINILEEASVSWGSSIVSYLEKIVVCGRNSNWDEVDGKGIQVHGSVSEWNLITKERSHIRKIELLREKLLRLLNILGCSFKKSIAARVLHQLDLALGENSAPFLGFTNKLGIHFGSGGSKNIDLDCSLNIIVLGKAGVGKSSTINSVLGEERSPVYLFHPGTTSVKEILGTVNGVKLRILDTPGLRVSAKKQALNRKMLLAVQKYIREFPPDVVLYVDRLDSLDGNFNDQPLMQTITRLFGSSIWEKAIVTLTHAGSYTSQDGPSSSPLSYEASVIQRSEVIRSCIGNVIGAKHLPPVCLVENNSREEVLPNGDSWREQLLLCCCSMKFMAEASSGLKPQDSFCPWQFFIVGENKSEMDRHGAKHIGNENVYVARNTLILDVLLDSYVYAKHGEQRSIPIPSNLEEQTQLLKSMRISAIEDNVDEGMADLDPPGLSSRLVPYQADFIKLGHDLAVRTNLRSSYSLSQSASKLDVLAGLKDKQRWKITLRATSSESLLVSLFSLLLVTVPAFQSLFHRRGRRTPTA